MFNSKSNIINSNYCKSNNSILDAKVKSWGGGGWGGVSSIKKSGNCSVSCSGVKCASDFFFFRREAQIHTCTGLFNCGARQASDSERPN